MEEKETQVEQPIAFEGTGESGETNVEFNTSNNYPDASNDGSAFGKFKDATSLVKAYDSLQAEFTRKSQKLSETLKKLEEIQSKSSGLAQESSEGSNLDISNNMTENKQDLNQQEVNSEEDKVKLQLEKEKQRTEWRKRVNDFLSSTPEAKEFTRDMADILKKNSGLKNSENGLQIAYDLARAKGLKKPADIIKDQSFIDDYVLNNQEIRSAIIKDYIQSMQTSFAVPKTMVGSSGTVFAHPSKPKPRTIADAGKLVSKMLGEN